MTDAMTLLILKASLLLAVAFVVRRLIRGGPAALRHGVWSAAFLALVTLPAWIVVLPSLELPVLADGNATDGSPATVGRTAGHVEQAPLIVSNRDAGASEAGEDLPRNDAVQLPAFSTILLVLWLTGGVLAAVALLVSFARVRRLVSTGIELCDSRWRDACARAAARLGFDGAVRVIACPGIRTPMAGGVLRAIVFVPADAPAWDDQRRDIVLAHEIAHLAHRDPLRNLVSRLACTLYWFHPFVWIAVRESAADCEQACDERVLGLGVRPSAYADLLLDFAARPLLNPKVAVPMVRRARLEQRLMNILEHRPRPAARRTVVPAFVALGLTVTLAAAHPVSRSEPGVRAPFASVAPMAVAPVKVVPPLQGSRRPVPTPTLIPEPIAAVQSVAPACWGAEDRSRPFSGQMSTSGTTIHEQIGRRGTERVLQSTYGDLRICMTTESYDGGRDVRPSQWPHFADRVILETASGSEQRTLDVNAGRVTYSVNGQARPIDDAARQWRDAALALADATWELAQLRGRVSSMRGEISSIYGQRSSLEGQISSYRGHVSSLNGEISSLRGQVSSMRGEISSIRGHESSLRGQISSERGAISSLRGMSWERARDIDVEARIRRHDENIRRIEQEIRDYDADARVREVERRIDAFDVERKVADVERRIREFDLDEKIARVRQEIDELEVTARVNGIEDDIRSLDAPSRTRELENRRDEALARLRRALRG